MSYLLQHEAHPSILADSLADMDMLQADIHSIYEANGSTLDMSILETASALYPAAFGQILTVLEISIYAKIIYDLWHHNQENHKGGIITTRMKEERARKNIITLKVSVANFQGWRKLKR